MIYPGEVKVRVDLDPEAMGCSDVTADDTSCTATITSNEMYSVSLTVTNDLDSKMTMRDFDCEFILVIHVHVHMYTLKQHICAGKVIQSVIKLKYMYIKMLRIEIRNNYYKD